MELGDAEVDVFDDATIEHGGGHVSVPALLLREVELPEDDPLHASQAITRVWNPVHATS